MFKSKIKSWFTTAKLAVYGFVNTVCNKAVALLTKSEEKEVNVIIAGTEEVVEEVNATIDASVAVVAKVLVTVATIVGTYFVVINLPITILFILECYFVYKAMLWTINWLSAQVIA